MILVPSFIDQGIDRFVWFRISVAQNFDLRQKHAGNLWMPSRWLAMGRNPQGDRKVLPCEKKAAAP
jgi:hypothetical protein